MIATRRQAKVLVLTAAACFCLAGGPKKAYQNVNRQIMIVPYWEDATPAANVMPGARTHERGESEKFEPRTHLRLTGADLSSALMKPDMKLFTLLREHRSFTVGGVAVEIDMDALRRFILGAKSNPELSEVLVFEAGFIVFAMSRDDGYSDVIVPVDPAVGAEVFAILEGAEG